jgi:uncharacterized protein (TIGR02231 family)
MRSIAVLPFLVVPLAATAAPAEYRPASRIEAVTVHQGAARVTRKAEVELAAGTVRVLLEGLPDVLADDSVRVEGRGAARAEVFGVSVERKARAVSEDADAVAAREAVERLEGEDRALEDRRANAQNRKALLESLRSTWVSERTENLAVRKADPKEWQALLEFSSRELAGILEELRAIDVAKRDLARRLAAARAEEEKLRAKARTFTKTVAVELSAERAGPLDLEVTYLVQGATWSPVWDARLDPDSGGLRMALRASIQQTTGEDWNDVRLEVSTSTPSRSLVVPELTSAWLDRYDPRRHAQEKLSRAYAPAPAAPRAGGYEFDSSEAVSVQSADEGENEAPEPVYELAQSTATVQEGLLSASFRIARRESVEGSGRPRKAFLADVPLQAELVRLAAPRIDSQVYLLATARNESAMPLLAGPVSLFLGAEFVGRADLPPVAAGDEVKLAFGADDRVQVERKIVDRFRDTRGILGKDEAIRYKVRTTLKNLYGRPVKVKLVDRIPVSRDGEVEVTVLEGTTKPTEKEDPMKPGVRVHLVELPAKAEKAIDLAYEVRWPKGQAISGLE